MACNTTVQRIDATEYIGNSLETINQNFANLRDGITTNCTSILSATNVLDTLRTAVTTLQGYAQGRPKAWVVFDGTRDINGTVNAAVGDRYINASYNIVEVYKESTGVYSVYFADSLVFADPPPGELPAYSALTTSATRQAGSTYYTWAQPTNYEVDRLTVVVNDGQSTPSYADPLRVTVAIF